jgi:hypothetical protein
LALVLIGRCWPIVQLARRERRFYFQPLWRRAVLLGLIPALLLATTPVQKGVKKEKEKVSAIVEFP